MKILQRNRKTFSTSSKMSLSKITKHLTILQIFLSTFLLFTTKTTTTHCLPVTSKPIENTPEHLAWEAWIMLPPAVNNDRHRKITPKSIFVLPNNINNNSNNGNNLPVAQPQIQCPPGHRIDNSKCIPTISINRDQLLIDQLTNLLAGSGKPGGGTNDGNDNGDGNSNGNYDDYDYDYNGETINYDLEMVQHFEPPKLINNDKINLNNPDDEQPLKINFSLDKFSTTKDDNNNNNNNNMKVSILNIKKDQNEYVTHIGSSEEFKLQPFRDQEPSSSSITISTTTSKETIESASTNQRIKNESENYWQQSSNGYPTIIKATFATTSTNPETINSSIGIKPENNESENFNTESKRQSEFSSTDKTNDSNNPSEFNTMELSSTNKNFDIFITTTPASDTTTTLSILSAEESEISSMLNAQSNDTSDYEDDKLTTIRFENEKNKNDNFEMVTVETEKNLEDNLAEESFVFDKLFDQDNTTESSSEETITDSSEGTTNFSKDQDFVDGNFYMTTTPQNDFMRFSTEEESETESIPSKVISSTNTDRNTQELENKKNQALENLEHKIVHVDRNRHNQAAVTISASQPIDWHEDREPLMESIESNNRFVYHHLGSSVASPTEQLQSISNIPIRSSSTISSTKSAEDIKEQLRIINMIVEENKRRYQQPSSKIRFPDDGKSQRTETFRFPTDLPPQSTIIPIQNNERFHPDKFLFHRRFFQSTIPTPTTTTSTTDINTQKPFWWLPSGWEIDQSGDRPMLIRFWSRTPPRNSEQFSSIGPITDQYRNTGFNTHIDNSDKTSPTSDVTHTTTTSGYRENSRSPTDNLYREISAQEVYKVLNAARQWKHSKR